MPSIAHKSHAGAVRSSLARLGRASSSLPAFRPSPGQLGPYRLLCELATGGMGTVYAARRSEAAASEPTVALKTIRADLGQRAEFVHMFRAEARVLSAIDHPGVCKLWDVGRSGRSPYLTMEYLIGEPLSRLFPLLAAHQGELSVSCIVHTLAKLCAGLHAVHELRDQRQAPLGIVHRDISPENLFLLYDGSARILDFGLCSLARPRGRFDARAGRERLGPEATIKGKCAYMSPEQVRAEPLDRRADLWSLGVVSWELLTGRPLFSHASEIKATVGVELGRLDPPSRHNRFVPAALDQVVMGALRRDPDERYPDALHYGRALESLIPGQLRALSAAALGGWLQGLFPGSKEYRSSLARPRLDRSLVGFPDTGVARA